MRGCTALHESAPQDWCPYCAFIERDQLRIDNDAWARTCAVAAEERDAARQALRDLLCEMAQEHGHEGCSYEVWQVSPGAVDAARATLGDTPAGRIGDPGVRDPDSPCEAYDPGKPTLQTISDCESDGHYLCKGCALFKEEPTND